MPQQTKIFRLFVSSTFNDMKIERWVLREKVFPVLEEFCREKGARFQAIDLRWGVNEESQRSQKTMEICRNEIRRCQTLSPRPNFLILLGDRYGWQPVPTAIPETEMKQISSHLLPDAIELVQKHYKLDENAVPAEYVLQPWGEHINTYTDWEPVENRLRALLREAAQKGGLSQESLIKYTTSATHQEILAGALNPPPDAADPASHVLCFSRTLLDVPNDVKGEEYIDVIGGKPDAYSTNMLEKLRGELKSRLEENFIEYKARWTGQGPALEDQQAFIHRTTEHLKAVIQAELAKMVDKDEIAQESQYHAEFSRMATACFTGRRDALDRIQVYLDDVHSNRVLSIIGASGSGKTSILAKAVMEAEKRNAVLVYRFIGANARSSNIISLLTSICGQIAQSYETALENLMAPSQSGQFLEIESLTELFNKCMTLASEERPLIIFLDALDQLSDADHAKTLGWLPRELAPYARIVVSSLPELAMVLNNTVACHLPALSGNEGEHLLDAWLHVSGRKLTPAQKKEVLDKFNQIGLPIFLKIAFEQAKKWRSYDSFVSLPETIPALVESFFASLEKEHSAVLVAKTVGYILSGKDKGLTEEEILDILVFDEEYWQYFLDHSYPAYRNEIEKARKLPVVVWSRLFLDLASYLTERDSFGERIICFYHRVFNEILKNIYIKDVKPLHKKLGEYFSAKPYYVDGCERKVPNVRRCGEQPWQQTKGEVWDEMVKTLCDLDFIQAKCAAGMTHGLVRDYHLALAEIPEHRPERQKEKECLDLLEKYTGELIAYASGHINKLDIIPSTRGWNESNIKREEKRLRAQATRVDCLKDFQNFIGREAGNLLKSSPSLPDFAIQQAWNYAGSGPVGSSASRAVEKMTPDERDRLLRVKDSSRPPWVPLPQILKTLTADTGGISAASMTPNGKRAMTGSVDGIFLWDLENGQLLKTLQGHLAGVSALEMTPDGKYAISGSSDKTCIFWNLETGRALKTLTGHDRWITAVNMTPDARYALSGSDDNTCILWDLTSGRALKTLRGHHHYIRAVSMTPDGRRAISASWDKTCILWDLATGRALKTLAGHTDYVFAVCLHPEGKRALSASSDHTCILWDLEKGKPLKTLKGHKSGVYAACMTPDGKYALSGSEDNTCILWELDRAKIVKTLRGHSEPIHAVCMTPDGKRALSASADATCILWDLQSSEMYESSKAPAGPISEIKVTPDNQQVFSGSFDNSCLLRDIESGEVLKKFMGHTAEVYAVDVHPDNKHAVSGSWDKSCILWDLKSAKALKTFSTAKSGVVAVQVTPDGRNVLCASSDDCALWDLDSGQLVRTFKSAYYGLISSVSMTPDGTLAITGSFENCILWDLKNGRALKKLKGHSQTVKTVIMTADGHRALSGAYDNTCIVWDLDSGQALRTLKGHSDRVFAIDVSADGDRAVSGSEDQTCILWDLKSGEALKILRGHSSTVTSVHLTADGRRVISGSRDKTCILWDLKTGRALKTLSGHADEVWAVCMTPDGRFAISGSEDKTCILWDLERGQALTTLTGHTDTVEAVSISADGRRAISGSSDATCIVWDLEKGRALRKLTGHTISVEAVTMTGDGKRALSGSGDNTCNLWDLESGRILTTLKGHNNMGRVMSLTPDGKLVFSGCYDTTCFLWDLATGQALKTFIGHTESVDAVNVSPDGKRAVSGSKDHGCILWDLASGKALRSFKGHGDTINSVIFSQDGRRLITGSEDKTCILWDLESGHMLARFAGTFSIQSVALYAKGILVGGMGGKTAVLNVTREMACPGPAIVTIRRLWQLNQQQYLQPTADCPFCGGRFVPEKNVLETIRVIGRGNGLGPNDSHCLMLPEECWDDPRLASRCPQCNEALRFNPFVVDPEMMSI